MQVGILITEGGPHPPEKWAEQTAKDIIDIGSSAKGALLAEATTFRNKVVEILTPHHAKVQEVERGNLAANGDDHLATAIDPTPHIEDPVAEILLAAKKTSFAAHFEQEHVQAYLRNLLASHFATAIHIERSWHADRNPDGPNARAFRQIHHPEA